MLDRITGMQVFARVAARGSLSAAARALDLSPTMVTKHVAALEARLGTRLLHRTTRRLTLTEAGRRYLAACERILPEIDEAEAIAAAERIEPSGTLRLNGPLSFGGRWIAPMLGAFAALYPQVSVDLGLNDRVVDLVEEGWDLAIRIGRLRDSSLIGRRLASCRLIICAAPSYLAARGTPTRAAELGDHNCLGYTLSTSLAADRWALGRDGQHVVPITGTLRASNGDALREAAVAGLGIIYQPVFLVADDLAAGRLVPLPLDQPPLETLAIHAVYPNDRNPPAKVRAFVDFIAARLGPVPPWEEPPAID